jgi:hypothetical protein
MGDAGARRIRERFSWQRTAEETLALYEEVLGSPKARRTFAPVRAAEPHPVP